MKTWVFPYKNSSKSAMDVTRGLGIRQILLQNSKFVPGKQKQIINWGSQLPQLVGYEEGGCKVINSAKAVGICSDKAKFLSALLRSGHANIPEFTVNWEDVSHWMDEGKVVLGRKNLRSRGGVDVYFSDSEDENDIEEFRRCAFWSVYIPKAREFRVHIMNGHVIHIAEKKLRTHDDNGVKIDPKKINWRVRNYTNGFIFAKEIENIPENVLRVAVDAFDCVNKVGAKLDFAAFDVIYNNKHDRATVLEANTAPGVEGTTLESYIEGFKTHYVIEA